MARRFAYVYFMKRLPDRIRDLVPEHVEYWTSRHLGGYSGGPFADRSGGLILFDAKTVEDAIAIADADPFVTNGVIETRWVKEWLRE